MQHIDPIESLMTSAMQAQRAHGLASWLHRLNEVNMD